VPTIVSPAKISYVIGRPGMTGVSEHVREERLGLEHRRLELEPDELAWE